MWFDDGFYWLSKYKIWSLCIEQLLSGDEEKTRAYSTKNNEHTIGVFIDICKTIKEKNEMHKLPKN